MTHRKGSSSQSILQSRMQTSGASSLLSTVLAGQSSPSSFGGLCLTYTDLLSHRKEVVKCREIHFEPRAPGGLFRSLIPNGGQKILCRVATRSFGLLTRREQGGNGWVITSQQGLNLKRKPLNCKVSEHERRTG